MKYKRINYNNNKLKNSLIAELNKKLYDSSFILAISSSLYI